MAGFDRRAVLRGSFGAAVGLGGTLGYPAAQAQASSQGEPFKLKLGNDLPATHSLNVRLRAAVDAISAETNGHVEISVFPNNQLGGDSDMMSQVRSGALEMGTFPGAVLSTLVPAGSLPALGFAFTNYDEVWAAMDGEVGNYIRRAIGKLNLVPFDAAWDNGFRQITTSTHPIQAPGDLKNFKIRVPVVPLWVSMFTALGAAPASIPLSEVYSALQTRITDGQENPLALIDSAKFYEVQKYCSLTNHAWDGFWLLVNGRVWRTVPADIQQIMAKHFNAAARKQRGDIVQANIELQKTLESKGLTFNTVEAGTFLQALARTTFYKDWRAKFGEEVWGLLQKYASSVG